MRFLLGGFGLIVGAIQCFFGYHIFRVLSAVIGFFVGAILGGLLGGLSIGSGGAILLALLFGLLGAWLAYTLYKIGVFVVCFLAGILLGLLGLLTGAVPLAFILGIIAGVLGVVLTKPAIILATSIGGGLSMGTALELMIGGAGTVWGILFAIAGAYVQLYMEKKKIWNGQTAQLSTTPVAVSVNGTQQNESATLGFKQTFSELKTGLLSVGEPRSIITNTKTTHSPKQTILVKNETPLWMQKLPIVVTEAQIVRGEGEGSVGLNLGVQNLGNDAIVGIFLLVRCYDLLKQEVEGIEKLVIQDISLLPGALWFSERPYPLPDSSTRRYELVVQSLVLSDGTIWNNEEQTPLAPLLSQEVLTLEEELANELFIQTEKSLQVKAYRPRSIFLYQPKQEEGYWNCACGQMNVGERCLVCGVKRDFLLELAQIDHLRESRQTRLAEQKRLEEERLAEQKRLEEERRQKLAEQTEAAKKKVAEVGNQTATVAKKGASKIKTLFTACMTKGQTFWTVCNAKTQTFWKETVLPNKKRILLVSGAAVLVLILSVGGYFGVNHYRAAQAEAARLEAERVEQEQLRAQEEEAKLEKAKALAEKDAQGLAYWEVVKKLPKMYLYDQKESASYTYQPITRQSEDQSSTWMDFGISDDHVTEQTRLDWGEGGLQYERGDQFLYNLQLLDFDKNGVDELLVVFGSVEQLHWQIWGYDGQRAILIKEKTVTGHNMYEYSLYLRAEEDGTTTLRGMDFDMLGSNSESYGVHVFSVKGQTISERQVGGYGRIQRRGGSCTETERR